MYAVHVNAIQLSLKFTCDCLVALSFNKYQWNIRGESTVLEGDNLQLLCKVSSRVEHAMALVNQRSEPSFYLSSLF